MPNPALPIAVLLLVAFSAAAQVSDEHVPSTIIAMERAALDRSDRGDAKGFLEISAPEVVYIDPSLHEPICGLDALTAYYRKVPVGEVRKGRMANARVQVVGEVAVLTFNYFTVRNWNATEVYRRTKDGWRIIHTHWSYLVP
jgi:ketosteroid isomerase-like protein